MRIWEGTSEKGTPVQLLVRSVAVPEGENQDAFQRELLAAPVPAAMPMAFPLRMVL